MRKALLPALASLALAMLSGGCNKSVPAPEPPRPVLVLRVDAAAVSAAQTYTGEVRSRYETPLAFRVPGKIVAREVNVGAEVRAGDVLMRLDPADTALSRASAQAQFDLADAELRRYRDLRRRDFVSQSALDAKEAAFKAVQAQLALSRNQFDYTVLRADKAGVIDQIGAEVGQVVAAGQPVMRHARTDSLEVAIAIPESRITQVRVRQPAEIRLWADDRSGYRGMVRELAAVADPTTRTYAARVSIVDPDDRVRLGMTAYVRLVEDGAAKGFDIPMTALFQRDGKPAVWVVGDDQTLTLRPVSVRSYGEKQAIVSGGLVGNERIVVAGVHKLNVGERVAPVEQPVSR